MNASIVPGVVAVVLVTHRHPRDRHVGAEVLAHHQRLLRRVAHRCDPGSTRARSAANTSPPRPSSASPDWCSPSAPTCSGIRSAGPPATSCCSSWSPPPCAAAAPTRCPTSPRRASARARCARSARCWSSAIGWLYLLPQFQGAGLTLRAAIGAPTWVGPLVVARVVLINVGSGGMRSITFVQAFQYWLKLTALLLPACVLLAVWVGDGAPDPTLGSGLGADFWSLPLGDGRRPGPLRHLLADRRDVPRHDGPAARRRAVLHQPRRPRRPPYDAGRARPARRLLPAPTGVRRTRPHLRRRPRDGGLGHAGARAARG